MGVELELGQTSIVSNRMYVCVCLYVCLAWSYRGEGLEEGIDEGLEEGLKEGLQEGFKGVLEEGQTALDLLMKQLVCVPKGRRRTCCC